MLALVQLFKNRFRASRMLPLPPGRLKPRRVHARVPKLHHAPPMLKQLHLRRYLADLRRKHRARARLV